MERNAYRPTSDAAACWLIAAMAVACMVAMAGLGFRVDPVTAMPPLAGLALLGVAACYGTRRARLRLRAGAIAFLQMTLFTILGVMLSYALAARAGPLWDGAFARADRMLGFDWPGTFRLVDASPLQVWIGGIAYHSLVVQMIVCIVVVSAAGQGERLRIAVTAAILSGFATILISGAMPAMGNLFDPAGYQRLWPSVAWMERDMIAGLRDGSWRTLDLTQLMGIVTFPSYHATLPIILAWAQRDVAGWRFVAPLWAGVTIVMTPLFGGHYGVDVLAGMALAVLGLLVAPALMRPAAVPRGTSGMREAGRTIVHLLRPGWRSLHSGRLSTDRSIRSVK